MNQPTPHGVIYDKPGWICSVCGFWNNIKDRICAGIHSESDGAMSEVDSQSRHSSPDPKPIKPERWLATDASETEAREHYSAMLDHYIALSDWYERRLLLIAQCANATQTAKIARESLL